MKIEKPRHDNDCVAAVLSSLLELPIEDLPDFWELRGKRLGAQYEAQKKWLAERGYHYYFSDCNPPRQLSAFRTEKVAPNCSWPPKGYWIGQISRVEWLRDNEPNHVVIMHDRKCIYNPGGDLKQVNEPDVWLIGYYLLVPLDPAK